MRRSRPRADPAWRFGFDSGELPVYALSAENLRYNRPDTPPNPPVAAKNRRNYGCVALLRAHLSRSRLRPEL
jgi:hypothetical protein